VLWNAGRERIAREERGRLAELYVGVRDGYLAGEAAVGRVKWTGASTPWYVDASKPVRSPEAQRAAIARLGRMFPGAVRRGDS